jgi:hypothetical protein
MRLQLGGEAGKSLKLIVGKAGVAETQSTSRCASASEPEPNIGEVEVLNGQSQRQCWRDGAHHHPRSRANLHLVVSRSYPASQATEATILDGGRRATKIPEASKTTPRSMQYQSLHTRTIDFVPTAIAEIILRDGRVCRSSLGNGKRSLSGVTKSSSFAPGRPPFCPA